MFHYEPQITSLAIKVCNISWKFRSSNCQNNCRSVNTVLLYFKSHTHLTEFDGIQCRSFKFLKENVKPNVHFN